MWKYKIKAFEKKSKIQRLERREIANWTNEDWDKWYAKGHERENKIAELQEKYKNSENKEINLGINLEARFGGLQSFLNLHGVKISSSHTYGLGKAKVDDII